MLEDFQKEYARLNKAQKQAVDAIDGPVLVVAGPGTGKTQLLATRVANILLKSDMNAANILCLTFTDSGRQAVQERLLGLIGHQAYKVAVHTFHSFGSHLMGAYSEHFSESFEQRPADELTRYEILSDILERLPHDNPLGTIYQDSYLYLKDILERISQLKQAGMRPDDLRSLVQQDTAWLQKAAPLLREHLGDVERIAKAAIPNFEAFAAALAGLKTESRLGTMCVEQLGDMLEASTDSTKPLTIWKNAWLTKRAGQNGLPEWVFIPAKQLDKLRLLADIYEMYVAALRVRRLYDYDDMILRVSDTLRRDPDLKAGLQEQYQYILVDEYQDTNGAQIQLLDLLADNPVHEARPNLMVVGDDDQAIYSFQGAYASNLLDFRERWREVEIITLDQNYRSTAPILSLARSLILQGEDRLETRYPEIVKQLHANQSADEKPQWQQFDSAVEQYLWLAETIKEQLESGLPAREIAVLAPKHKHLAILVPYLLDRQIPVSYEKRQDILEEEHIRQLIMLARVVGALAGGELDEANQLLPELLSYPWWQIEPGWLWELHLVGRKAHGKDDKDEPQWLELMRRSSRKRLNEIAGWLLLQAKQSLVKPLELQLDELIGPAEPEANFASPYRSYFFPVDGMDKARLQYVDLLSSLVSLRSHLRQYAPDRMHMLRDFVDFVQLRQEAGLKIVNDHPLVLEQNAVRLMTAHKAKGLEFTCVYLINVDEHTWVKERGRTNKIALPVDLSIAPAGQTTDERLRVFYVALTRAKQQLQLSTYLRNDQGEATLPLGWLGEPTAQSNVMIHTPKQQVRPPDSALSRGLSFDWRSPHFDLHVNPEWRDLLSEQLKSYQLSPTHLTAFLNVADGGPKGFLINQLLRFPAALSPSAQFGNAMHALMRRLHTYFNEHKKLPSKTTAQRWLEQEVTDLRLGLIEEPKQLRRGEFALNGLYQKKDPGFKAGQQAEVDFAGEGVMIGMAHLRGVVDQLEIDQKTKTAFITDYKTGKSVSKWPSPKTRVTPSNSYELHKMHRYRQQLLFYKLLVEGSRSYGEQYTASGAALEFLEPDGDERIVRLELTYEAEELERLKRLIGRVWEKVTTLDLPNTEHYPSNFDGVRQFESDLLEGKI